MIHDAGPPARTLPDIGPILKNTDLSTHSR